ncbi:MAG: type II toxin-antitoxin system MqsA family antitoxin [Oscillospiraceae bacterium]|jgi:YgiT-type zinc finger domain-containing protein|nr:type II toxin-antitoxin system MqsA family antitoxin [Oscillospiraceae bacterium]
MNCFYCKGTLKNSITTHVVNMKTCIIIIKDTPCTECVQCNATYYDNDVVLQLEKIVKEMKTAITEVAIVNYELLK